VLTASLKITENRFRQHQLGILPDAPMAQLAANPTWYTSWWFRDWWRQQDPNAWQPDFVAYMESEVLQPSR